MKRIFLDLIFLSLISSLRLFTQQSSDDFFPLSVGNRWTYNYFASDDEQLGSFRTRDSGLVTYKIVSRSLGSDSIIWNVQEVRNITHYYKYYFPPVFDTTYIVHDSTTFPIIEYQKNDHQLVSWATNWQTVFYFRPEFADSNVLFRYYPSETKDTFTVIQAQYYRPPLQSRLAQLFKASFQRGVGLTMASYTAPGLTGWVPFTYHTLNSSFLTPVESAKHTSLPKTFDLQNNFPNPFNPGTTIVFENPTAMRLKLSIYDELGRLVETILNDEIQPGRHSIQWIASHYSSGVYFCVAQIKDHIYSLRLTLIK
jgi:hypothetical protein